MLLAPLDLPNRERWHWPDGVVLWPLIARGLRLDDVADQWRSYLVDVQAPTRIPEPATERSYKDVIPTRTITVIGGSVSLDGYPLTLGSTVAAAAGSVVAGPGRAVVVENWPDGRTPPVPELVELRQNRTVKNIDVLVLSGRLGVARRMAGVQVIPPEHVALGCKGELRPGSTAPWIVLFEDGR